MPTKLHLIHLKDTPILTQLQMEEALLRTDERNFLIINEGSPKAIVMGISGEMENLVHPTSAREEKIPVIKRFSGGGTVIVDENTLFLSFIMNKEALAVPPFPEPILRWTADLYRESWEIGGFHLRENDYCIGDKKCGGNAQYIKKDRWLHHTSFLWDYTEENMRHLLMPLKRPNYRQDRPHTDFLTRMKGLGEMSLYIEKLKKSLENRGFELRDFDLKSWKAPEHRQATYLLS